MKFILFFLALSFNSYAVELLDGKELLITKNPVVLETTVFTTFNNLIKIPVSTMQKECTQFDEVAVYEQNGYVCGYDSEPTTVCVGADNCFISYIDVESSCSVIKKVCKKYVTKRENEFREFNLQLLDFSVGTKIELSIDEDENLKLNVLDVNPRCIKKTVYRKNNKYTGAKLKLKKNCN